MNTFSYIGNCEKCNRPVFLRNVDPKIDWKRCVECYSFHYSKFILKILFKKNNLNKKFINILETMLFCELCVFKTPAGIEWTKAQAASKAEQKSKMKEIGNYIFLFFNKF